MAKVKIKMIRDHGTRKKNKTYSVDSKEAHFLMMNSFASKAPCKEDCKEGECEECKSKKKKKAEATVSNDSVNDENKGEGSESPEGNEGGEGSQTPEGSENAEGSEEGEGDQKSEE